MANSKEIKNQIASIGNTQKISAMEKVAVSKMKKNTRKNVKRKALCQQNGRGY